MWVVINTRPKTTRKGQSMEEEVVAALGEEGWGNQQKVKRDMAHEDATHCRSRKSAEKCWLLSFNRGLHSSYMILLCRRVCVKKLNAESIVHKWSFNCKVSPRSCSAYSSAAYEVMQCSRTTYPKDYVYNPLWTMWLTSSAARSISTSDIVFESFWTPSTAAHTTAWGMSSHGCWRVVFSSSKFLQVILHTLSSVSDHRQKSNGLMSGDDGGQRSFEKSLGFALAAIAVCGEIHGKGDDPIWRSSPHCRTDSAPGKEAIPQDAVHVHLQIDLRRWCQGQQARVDTWHPCAPQPKPFYWGWLLPPHAAANFSGQNVTSPDMIWSFCWLNFACTQNSCQIIYSRSVEQIPRSSHTLAPTSTSCREVLLCLDSLRLMRAQAPDVQSQLSNSQHPKWPNSVSRMVKGLNENFQHSEI